MAISSFRPDDMLIRDMMSQKMMSQKMINHDYLTSYDPRTGLKLQHGLDREIEHVNQRMRESRSHSEHSHFEGHLNYLIKKRAHDMATWIHGSSTGTTGTTGAHTAILAASASAPITTCKEPTPKYFNSVRDRLKSEVADWLSDIKLPEVTL